MDSYSYKIKKIKINAFKVSLEKTVKRNCPLQNYKLVTSAKVCESEKATFFDFADMNEFEFYLFCYPTIDGKAISSLADLKMVLAQLPEKRTSVEIEVLRNSKSMKITEPVTVNDKMNVSVSEGVLANQDGKAGWCR